MLVGDALRPRLTVDGLRQFLADWRKAGRPNPQAILVSEHDRRDLNQDLLAGSVIDVAKPDQSPQHDHDAIGVIEGVPIFSHRDVGRGQARLLLPDPRVDARVPT